MYKTTNHVLKIRGDPWPVDRIEESLVVLYRWLEYSGTNALLRKTCSPILPLVS